MRLVSLLCLLVFTLPIATVGQDTSYPVEVAIVDKLLLSSRFSEAIQWIDSLSGESPSPFLHIKRVEGLVHLSQFHEARALLEDLETSRVLQGDLYLSAFFETVRGFLQLKLGVYDEAERILQNALLRFDSAKQSSSVEAAQAVAHLGTLQMSQGKYTEAQELLHRALSIRDKFTDNRTEWIAATYNDLGLVYSQTDKNRALEYYQQATELYTSLYGHRDVKIALANINAGIIYRDLALLEEAMSSFQRALDILNVGYANAHPTKGIVLYNLGQTYVRLNDQELAMEYYRSAVKTYEQFYGGKHPEIASVLTAMGDLQAAASDFDSALASYQKAIQANIPGYTNPEPRSNPPLRNYYNGLGLLNTLASKAAAFEARYTRKSLKFSDLEDALDVLILCDSLIDQLRQHASNESDKLRLGAVAGDVYGLGVGTAFQAAMNAVKKQPYLEKAFFFAEKSKGAVLLEAISEASARTYAGISAELLSIEKKLRSDLTAIARKLAEKPSTDEERSLRERSFDLKAQYDAFLRRVEENYPDYYDLKFNTSVPSVSQLQLLLDDNTALISYFIDNENANVYIFQVTKSSFKVRHRALTSQFEKYITGLRNSLYFQEFNAYKTSAYNLGRTLLPPLPNDVTNLIIVPSGKLSLIPFETLLNRDVGDAADYKTLPYLIRRYAIRYEFSVGLLLQKAKKKATPKNMNSILLCAPVSFPDETSLQELPGTEEEVHNIAQVFARNNYETSLRTFVDADETFIKTGNLKAFNFIHLATHGVVDETAPELSRIYVRAGKQGEDGSLYAGEIFNLELNADLVALSACQTGMGKVMRGEGVIGLSRALLYAGARNVMVSFWSVGDQSTAKLMTGFYEQVLNDPALGYSQSLRKAKLRMLEHETFSAPFYWAPFVLIGF